MNILNVPILKTAHKETTIERVNEMIDRCDEAYIPLNSINWPEEYPEKPIVGFKIFQLEDQLILKFNVSEVFTRAIYTKDNDRVYTDSCVELFIDPSGDGSYYNLEFNAIGTLLFGYGKDRHGREQAPSEVTKLIKRIPSLGFQPIETVQLKKPWELTVMIPLTAFWHHTISSITGKKISGNIQKCGDDLPTPHFITWSPINTPHPDYHQPAFFGILQF